MPTSNFSFTLEDMKDDSTFTRAVGRNQINITPNGEQKALVTSRAKDPTALSNLTTWSYSDIMQGSASLKPIEATYDVFNQNTSNSLVEVLTTQATLEDGGSPLKIDNLLSAEEQAFGAYDVIAMARKGETTGGITIDGVVGGATNDPNTVSLSAPPPPSGSVRSYSEVRNIWANKCAKGSDLTTYAFKSIAPSNPNKNYSVHKSTVYIWEIIDNIFLKYKYQIRDTSGGFNCRKVTGGSTLSLHSFGIACDFNAPANPYGKKLITDMPGNMIAEIEQLKAKNGTRAIQWGGRYTKNKDAMHFEIMLTPEEIRGGLSKY